MCGAQIRADLEGDFSATFRASEVRFGMLGFEDWVLGFGVLGSGCWVGRCSGPLLVRFGKVSELNGFGISWEFIFSRGLARVLGTRHGRN